MAKSTKKTYKSSAKGKLKPVVRKVSVNVSELNYSERREYIEGKYAPFIVDGQMIFSIWDSGIEYDYKGDRDMVVSSIIQSYKDLADYTEASLSQESIYEIQDWGLVRRDIDPDTDEVIGETPLEELSADNTYNFSYLGLVDLNWRVYHDEDYDRYFYVIMPHLGGDIRGNYGDAIILEGNDKDELFYRFYEGFISGGASIYFKFIDGSEIGFDSEQDSDSFSFRVNEVFEATGMASHYLQDFEQLDSYAGDIFLEETIDIYLARTGVAPKMMAGGSLNDETPMAYIQILGYDEGKWFNLTDFSDGQDVIDGIYDWMNELNEQFGGNREEYEVTDYEGFGNDLYDEYMGANEFEEIIEAYEKYESSDFPADVISSYKSNSGSRNDSLSDIIDEMDNNYFGKYDNLNDFGYEMVEQGVYQPSEYDVYITDTDKRIIAGEEADNMVYDMSFEDLLKVAPDTEYDYDKRKSELEDEIVELQDEINDLTALQNDTDNDEEYERISDEIETKEIELEYAENSYTDIDSDFEDKAREEARESFYDEIYDRLENDLEGWLSDYGYDTDNLADVPFLGIDYEKIGDELSIDYLVVEYDGEMYFFNNYAKGGRITASKRKPKYEFYIVESSTKKIVSGYNSKAEATEQRKLLVKEYPTMRFEIFTLGNLEAKTDLDVYAKKDYVELSTLDKIKKVSVDAYRYGQEKVGQAQVFLEKNDVKGKIKRGARKVWDKTKQGGNWLKRQWQEADFGDGKGKAKFFADGGMAGLGDVSAMLPNPLPMSTITPMAKGGSVEDNLVKELHKLQRDLNSSRLRTYFEGDNSEEEMGRRRERESKLARFNEVLRLLREIDSKKYADGGNVQYVPVQAVAQQPVQYVPVQQMPQQPQQPVNSPMGNIDINSALDFVKQNPQVLAMLGNGGSVQAEIDNLDNRIHNLEELVVVINEDEKPEMYATINKLKKERENLLKNGNKPEEVNKRKSFFGLFAKGGEMKLPKNNSRVHFTDDEGNEFDGIFIEATDDNVAMFLVGFGKGSSDFRFPMEITDWNYLDDENNDDAHARHEASETAEEEKAEHEYDVYDNKRMLQNQANEIQHHSEELNNQVKITKKVPAWVIAKTERATTDLSDITHYLDGENKMADGGQLGEIKYEVVPHLNKFIVVKITYKQHEDYTYPSKEFIYGFNGKFLEFDDIKSAEKFILNVEEKYPYGKANAGMLLLASELMKNQQPQQPQVVYYVPQPQPQEQAQNTGIVQNVPEMANGGDLGYDDDLINDFCITNLIELANEIQPVKYFVTDRFKQTDFESKNYKGRLMIVFKEPASVNVIEAITKFIEKAEDCHHILEQSVNVSGSEPTGVSINLLSDRYSDREFNKGGKVYDYAPKKINIDKTKKIRTNLGDYILGLVTKDFVYFVNIEEGDENANTIMYNKKGELLSDNYFANNDLFETLENESEFEFIHPDVEYNRQQIIKGN
jgi:hypothetical protein